MGIGINYECCSKRPRFEPVFFQPVAGLSLVAERNIIKVLGKYA